MEKLRLLDLFSGIGGFSHGLERTGGFQTVAFCEIDAEARNTLHRHWPETPIYDDIRTLNAARLSADSISVDAICGGFPCQDVSRAGDVWGLGKGLDGARSGLWRDYVRLIGELRPRVVFVENVAALLDRGIGDVLGSLAAIGYDAEWRCIPASGVGAPHSRDRVWIVAYPSGSGLARPVLDGDALPFPTPAKVAELGDRSVPVRGWWAEHSPPVCMGDGVPAGLVRSAMKGCGNAVVPEIPRMLGAAVLSRPELFHQTDSQSN